MASRYPIRVSVYMLGVLISAVMLEGSLLAAYAIGGRPARTENVYIRHNGAVAIDARVWPFHQLSPGRRAVNTD